MPVSALTTFGDGSTFTGAQLNNEFAQGYTTTNAKFDASAGHKHTGAVDGGPPIGKPGLTTAVLNWLQHTNMDAAKPSVPITGMLDFATDTKTQYMYDGTAWQTLVSTGQPQTWPLQTLTVNNIITTSTDALKVENATTTTAGVPVQQSPNVHEIGHAWDTFLSTDKSVDFQSVVVPVSGNPASGAWKLQSSVGGTTFTDALTVSANGVAQTTMLTATGLAGATTPTRYVGGTASGPPTSGTFTIGDFVIDQSGTVWICTTSGTSGSWIQLWKGESHVWLSTPYQSFNTTSTTFVPIVTGGWDISWVFLSGRWPSDKWNFEAWLYTSSSSCQVYAALRDINTASVYPGIITSGPLGSNSIASITVDLVNSHSYEAVMRVYSGTGTAFCLGARLRTA